MIRHHLKIGFRNLMKHKIYSFINIFGLALGLTCAMLIALYVWDEMSYDRFNEKSDRIYRVNSDITFGGEFMRLAVSSDALAGTMLKDYPFVEKAARLRGMGARVRKGSENIREPKMIYADASFFDIFTLPAVAGNTHNALEQPNTLIITESTARKYFGKTDVVGQTLLFNDKDLYKINAVIADIPSQSHFHFDFFVSMAGLEEARQNIWLSNNFNTYLLVRPGTTQQTIITALNQLFVKYIIPQASSLTNIHSIEEFKKAGNDYIFGVTPVKDIHLHSDRIAELEANSSMEYIYIFSFIALFILLIACINFMNLSTARSAGRAREVGVRKVLGSLRENLIGQFLTESVLLSFAALIIAVLFCWLLLPFFNDLSGKHIQFTLQRVPSLVFVLVAFTLITGLLAGSYPAFYLSSFNPVQVLKGRMSGLKRSSLRSGLVVFQFATSTALIIGTLVIYNQLNFIQNKKLGFNREKVLVISGPNALGEQARVFKEEVLRLPGVVSGTMTGFLPTNDYRSNQSFFKEPIFNEKNAISVQNWTVDEDYVPTLGMEIVKGRNFSKEMSTDSTMVLINEAAAKLLGYDDPLGKNLYTFKDLATKSVIGFTIIGVVKNFHFESLRNNISPVCLFMGHDRGAISFRVNTKNMAGLISSIQAKWKSLSSGQPFEYSFMDEDFIKLYSSEQRIGKIFISFATLALLIACLGLFGLAAYMAERRTKEIGIRKVLGASVGNIVSMLSANFLRLVLISVLIAFPIAWWGMHRWLEDFAYRAEISWWIFAVAGGCSILIALLTIVFMSLRAAVANPVNSIRME